MTVRAKRHSIPLICMEWKERLTEERWIVDFRDDFDDAFIGDDWALNQTEEDAWVPAGTKTVTEAADLLSIAIAEGTSGHWSEAANRGANKAPKAYMELGSSPPYRITTKITNFTFNPDGDNFGGLIVGVHPDQCYGMFGFGREVDSSGIAVGETISYGASTVGKVAGSVTEGGTWGGSNANGYVRWIESQDHWPNNTWIDGTVGGADFFKAEYRAGLSHRIYMFGMKDEAGPNRIRVRSNTTLYDADGASTIPVWLKIEIDEDWDITFWFSTDGVNYTQYEHAAAPFEVNVGASLNVGLFASNNNAGKGATSVSFEFFLIERLADIGEYATNEECISFQDVRSPDRVYAGRVISLSPLKRALDDRTGLYKVADMTMVLANNDRYYSERVAGAILKNQEVNVYHAFTEDPEVGRTLLMKMFIDDHSLKGTEFHVKMKDATQKYFAKKIPANVCTEEDYPNIHPDHVGRMMPEVLGECIVDLTHEHPGAIEAVHVNTAMPWQYLLSRGPLNAVTAVYVDDVLWNPINYAFIPGTPSLLNLASDEGDSRLTFDAEGYSIPAWDSANGYIQNIVYIIEYLLHYLMDMSLGLIDQTSFDNLATYFDDKGFGEIGHLILQNQQDAMEILRQLLFSGRIKGYVAKGGRFTVDKKSINDFAIASLDSHLFTQTDLVGAPDKPWNLKDAVNTVNVRNGYIPWQQLWLSAVSDFLENEMDGIMEGDIPIRDIDRGNRGIIIG